MKDDFFYDFIFYLMKSKYIQLMNVTNGDIIKISVCTFTFNPDIYAHNRYLSKVHKKI